MTTTGTDSRIVLMVKNLKTSFFTAAGTVRAVDDISFEVRRGECLCLVGESGCGKTAASLSILRLIDSPPGQTVGGEVLYNGEDLLKSPADRLRAIRGNRIAMIFQDPQSSLNPVYTVGDQITEAIKLHSRVDDKTARERAIGLMKQLGIPSAEARFNDYPHQFSGGMQQRVMIAMALSCDPEILIADEPTTALDVTIKAQILEIFEELTTNRQMSIIFITHDLSVVADIADRIIVMYGGHIVETGTAFDIFDEPKHPYTTGLMNCLPDISTIKSRLTPIPGTIPDLIDVPTGCVFHPRCPRVMDICRCEAPPRIALSGEHTVVCHLYGKNHPTSS